MPLLAPLLQAVPETAPRTAIKRPAIFLDIRFWDAAYIKYLRRLPIFHLVPFLFHACKYVLFLCSCYAPKVIVAVFEQKLSEAEEPPAEPASDDEEDDSMVEVDAATVRMKWPTTEARQGAVLRGIPPSAWSYHPELHELLQEGRYVRIAELTLETRFGQRWFEVFQSSFEQEFLVTKQPPKRPIVANCSLDATDQGIKATFTQLSGRVFATEIFADISPATPLLFDSLEDAAEDNAWRTGMLETCRQKVKLQLAGVARRLPSGLLLCCDPHTTQENLHAWLRRLQSFSLQELGLWDFYYQTELLAQTGGGIAFAQGAAQAGKGQKGKISPASGYIQQINSLFKGKAKGKEPQNHPDPEAAQGPSGTPSDKKRKAQRTKRSKKFENDEKKRRSASKEPGAREPATPRATVKVFRFVGEIKDRRVIVKEDDLYDEVAITSQHMTVGDVADKLLTPLSLHVDTPHWFCNELKAHGRITATRKMFPVAELQGDLVMVDQGGDRARPT